MDKQTMGIIAVVAAGFIAWKYMGDGGVQGMMQGFGQSDRRSSSHRSSNPYRSDDGYESAPRGGLWDSAHERYRAASRALNQRESGYGR